MRSVPQSWANVSILGEATNLAARLQAQAGRGEVLLSVDAHRRVQEWLHERGLDAVEQRVALKGIGDDVVAYRVR